MGACKDQYKPLPHFDPDYVVRGIYTRSDDNRKSVYERNIKTGKFKMKLLSRYLAEQHLERFLPTDQEVDHIDSNPFNDTIENLQILPAKVNRGADSLRIKPMTLKCAWCKISFTKVFTRNSDDVKKGCAGPFCSQKCSRVYSAKLVKGETEKLPAQEKFIFEYYKNEKVGLKINFNFGFYMKLDFALSAEIIPFKKKVYIKKSPEHYPYWDNNYYCTQPHMNKKSGRMLINIVCRKTKVRRHVPYARYLMENHLKRVLGRFETVDHIDQDKTNDVLENLQVLDLKEHIRLDAKRVIQPEYHCVICDDILIGKTTASVRANAKLGRSGPFCKKCQAKNHSDMLKGKVEKLPIQEVKEVTYYCNKDLEDT